MKTLRWISVHEELPGLYESVIVAYKGSGPGWYDKAENEEMQVWLVGAGHATEDGWTVESDCETDTGYNGEEIGPFQVLAWMEYPDPPELVLRGRTVGYE